MKVASVRFVESAGRADQFPRDGRPEVAFAGRSNVGKSSLLNALLGRKGVAKTSGTPGKTRTINFYDVNGRMYFADLPGYGYACVPKAVKERWGRLVTEYLTARPALRLVVQLVDARHPPTDRDLEMLDLLDSARVPTLIAATKVDKLKQSERGRNLGIIRKRLDLEEDALLIPFSAVTGEGVGPIWQVIDDLVAPSAMRGAMDSRP